MSSINGQLGGKIETTVNTPVVVDRFWPFANASVKPLVWRGDAEGIRASGRGLRSDGVRVFNRGAVIEIEMEVLSKGFGWWLRLLMGTLATTGPTDSAYNHRGTFGSLFGTAATLQLNDPFNPSGTDCPFTFAGCKVLSWEMGLKKGAKLMVKMTVDAMSYVTATALASASYPTTPVPYTAWDFAATIGGSAVSLDSFTIKVDLGLDVDSRDKIKGSAIHEEAIHAKHPKVSWDFEADFSSLTQHDRVRAANAATSMAALVFAGSIVDTGQNIGVVPTLPSFTATIAKARFDDIGGIEKKAPDGKGSTQKLSGEGRFDGTNSMLQLDYVSSDVTA